MIFDDISCAFREQLQAVSEWLQGNPSPVTRTQSDELKEMLDDLCQLAVDFVFQFIDEPEIELDSVAALVKLLEDFDSLLVFAGEREDLNSQLEGEIVAYREHVGMRISRLQKILTQSKASAEWIRHVVLKSNSVGQAPA